jgi:hypothetical protein
MSEAKMSGHGDPRIGVTTVEASERRHLVQPYDDQPVLELATGVVACLFCGNNRFRRSRLRFSDLGELLLLRYPLRCTRCGQRQYNSIHIAFLSFAPRSTNVRQAQGTDTWQNWTGPANSGQRVARPLSTAIGPRAQRLEAAQRPETPEES